MLLFKGCIRECCSQATIFVISRIIWTADSHLNQICCRLGYPMPGRGCLCSLDTALEKDREQNVLIEIMWLFLSVSYNIKV